MSNKVVVLGVTGSIAAYKAVDLTSMLVKVGVDVNVIMTEAARKIITEQAFFTLSKNRVVTDLWTIPDWKPGHIELAEKADLFVVAPCTANFMGKYVNGIADDALTTFALSHTGKTVLAPAMNTNMWNNPIVKRNYKSLVELGVLFVGPATGHLACGTEGTGKMSDPETIYKEINTLLSKQ
ncbi:MAG TPA: flavoprotein [Victivallales bacterium]|nr:flavoprotein [Victivallales bacterium]